jgi:AGCS family alanine or glycine:cation symporter
MLPESVRAAIFWVSDAVWGWWTYALLLGTGLFLTIRLGFVQVVRFRDAVRTLIPAASAGARGALTPFQAFMTALGASIGTGNIAGVATAVVTGGPGVVFWIWCYGFRHRHQVHRSGAGHPVPRGERRPPVRRAHALPPGRAPRALARLDVRAGRGVAALTTTPFTQPNSIAVVWRASSTCRRGPRAS